MPQDKSTQEIIGKVFGPDFTLYVEDGEVVDITCHNYSAFVIWIDYIMGGDYQVDGVQNAIWQRRPDAVIETIDRKEQA